MSIFRALNTSPQGSSHNTHNVKRARLSADQVRAKMQAQKMAKQQAKIMKAHPMKTEDSVDVKKAAHHLKLQAEMEEGWSSDISDNDPNSAETTEKLKEILKSGAFSFSDREKSTLAKILSER